MLLGCARFLAVALLARFSLVESAKTQSKALTTERECMKGSGGTSAEVSGEQNQTVLLLGAAICGLFAAHPVGATIGSVLGYFYLEGATRRIGRDLGRASLRRQLERERAERANERAQRGRGRGNVSNSLAEDQAFKSQDLLGLQASEHQSFSRPRNIVPKEVDFNNMINDLKKLFGPNSAQAKSVIVQGLQEATSANIDNPGVALAELVSMGNLHWFALGLEDNEEDIDEKLGRIARELPLHGPDDPLTTCVEQWMAKEGIQALVWSD